SLKDRKLMIAIIAVIFVPLLYAGMFLWAFWDPYDRLEDIPVAIVNEDVAYSYEDELFELGDELVDKLKEEDDFDFHFVDRQVGYKGLQDEDYYILIEIPHDFSKNATTLMDDHPEKLRLRYVPNESYNFLASQIGETAMLHIEMTLEEKIIESYTETMFDQVDEIAEGLEKATDATEELDDGADELKENTHLLKDHLATLAEKSIEFVDGTSQLTDGANKLTDGTRQLSDGVGQLSEASGQLLGVAKKLESGQKELSNGLKTANDGAEEINRNIPTLISGTDEFSKGLKQFEEQLPGQLAKEIDKAVSDGTGKINAGGKELENGILNGLGASSKNANGLAAQLSAGLSEQINQELGKVAENTSSLPNDIAKGISTSLAQNISAQNEAQVQEISQALQEAGLPEEQINAIVGGLVDAAPTEEQLQEQLEGQIAQGISAQLPDVNQIINEKQAEISTKIEQGVYGAVGETEKQVSAGFSQFTKEINNNLGSATKDIESKIAAGTKDTFGLLNEGINSISSGQKTLQGGVNQLADGTKELSKGAQTLNSGQNEYISQM